MLNGNSKTKATTTTTQQSKVMTKRAISASVSHMALARRSPTSLIDRRLLQVRAKCPLIFRLFCIKSSRFVIIIILFFFRYLLSYILLI